MKYYQNRTAVPSHAAPAPPANLRWIITVVALTLGGSVGGALTALAFGKKDLALGLFLGGILSTLNFYGLKRLTEKVLRLEEQKARAMFWLLTGSRWVLFALACWGLLKISPFCLLGAMASYLWFLLVLGWVGWRSAFPAKLS